MLWAALAEKAYAQFAEFGLLSTDGPKTNSYAALDEGYPNLAMGNILGMFCTGHGNDPVDHCHGDGERVQEWPARDLSHDR